MKNRIFFLLLWTFLLFGCSKNPDTPLPTDPPEEVINNKYAITSEGGTINDKGSGVKIEIPKGATEATLNFTITKSPHTNRNLSFIGDNNYPAASDIYKIENDALGNLLTPATVSIVYDPSIIDDPTKLEIAYFSESINKWIPAEIDSLDTKNNRVIFQTTHFSLWTLFLGNYYTKDMDSRDTGFRPNLDGFPFDNTLPQPYNKPTLFGIGNCAGMSGLSIMYYNLHRNDSKEKRLGYYAYRGPDIQSRNYSDIFTGIYKASKELNTILAGLTKIEGLIPIKLPQSASKIYFSMKKLNLPVFVSVRTLELSWPEGLQTAGHAIVVYRYVKNDDGTGKFYYYNPNIRQNDTLSFTHNTDGTINTFEYTGDSINPHYAKLLSVSTQLGGFINFDNVKKIIDTYFTQPTNSTPLLITLPITNITQTTAVSGGKITYDGGTAVTTRGICWSTSKNPTIDNNKTSDGTGTGEFTSKITNLTPNTTYYVRAYATNINGTAYGNEISFITQKNIDLPLKLSVSSLSLNVNATENIEVTSGNGSYTVVSSDANIATATISGSIITIKGITEGNTTVAVTDTQSKETATVAVTVNKVDVPPPTDRPKMAIEYFAEYNINKDGTGFVTDHNSDDMGFFNWYEAAGIQDSIYNKDGRNLFAPTGLLKDWRLPTGEEWMGLTGSFSGLTFNYSIHEAVTVGGVDKTYISDYLKSRGALTTFALRFKQAASERAPGFPPATDNSMLSAYRYDYVLNSENNKSKFYFKITVRYLGNDFTGNIDTISNYLFWQTNNSDDIIFILPTRGYLLPDNTTDNHLPFIGYYWSNKHINNELADATIFGEQRCGPGNGAHKYLKFSIRPIKK